MWPSKNIIQVLEHSPEPFIVYSHLYSQLENRLTAGCLQVTARTRTTTADRYTAHGLHSCILCTPLTPWVAAGPPRLISTSSGRRHACSRTRGLGAATRAPGWRGVIGRATRCEIHIRLGAMEPPDKKTLDFRRAFGAAERSSGPGLAIPHALEWPLRLRHGLRPARDQRYRC